MPKKNPATAEAERRRAAEFYRRLAAHLGSELRSGRRVNGADLARATKIDKSTVTRILNGRRDATSSQIASIAHALGAPDLIPEEVVPVSAVSSPPGRVSAPAFRLPPGLEGFLERHEKRLDIKRRERWYLEHDRTETDAWVVKNDGFWERRLRFWREEIKIQDAASGASGEEDHP